MSPRASPCTHALYKKIQESLATSVDKRDFLPTDKLDDIFTFEAIDEAVRELRCDEDERIKLAETIFHSGKRIFAMLIDSRCQDLIVNFRRHEVLDNRLPITEDDAERVCGDPQARRLAKRDQWMFCPYSFPENMSNSHIHVDKNLILPFTDSDQIGTGAFGNVERMIISPSHQRFTENTEIVQVARKQLKAKGLSEDFEREHKCLRVLNTLRHPSIVPFWGSYRYGGEQNLLFPYFEMTLNRFLAVNTRYRKFQWEITFYSALQGLASALSQVHNLHLSQASHGIDFEAIGYHHDIRPHNILVSDDTFILADFGLGRVRSAQDFSHTPYKPIMGNYVAPECTDMQETPLKANRAVDVWAFGCLTTEVVTYMIKGANGLDDFRKTRIAPGRLALFQDAGFYQPDGQVKPEVTSWLRGLKSDIHCDLAGALIELCFDILHPDPSCRPGMATICQTMEDLSLRKHFHSVRQIFCQVCDAAATSAHNQRHIENLRFAYNSFILWGSTSQLDAEEVVDYVRDRQDVLVNTLKELYFILVDEESGIRPQDRPTPMIPGKKVMSRVDKLWQALPENLRQLKGNFTSKDDSGKSSSSPVPADSRASVPRLVLDDLENAAQTFRSNLPQCIAIGDIDRTTSIHQFYDITEMIQKEQQSNGLRNMARIEQYLARLQQLGTVITRLFGDSHLIQTVLWGPLALLLQWAAISDSAFDSLIEVIVDVAKALPDFEAFTIKFSSNSETSNVLVLFLKSILQLYREALEPFSRPDWIHVFDLSWRKHKKEIVHVIGELRSLTQLMGTGAQPEQMLQELEIRNLEKENLMLARRETRRQEFHGIKTSLGSKVYYDTLYRLRGLRCKDTESWLVANATYREWYRGSEGSRILWLRGIPGAGKTTLVSAIVDRLFEGNAKLAFAFLSYNDSKVTALSILHSLIFQLAEEDDDLMAIVCKSAGNRFKSDITVTTDLLSKIVSYVGLVYLVVDGLDEIDQTDRYMLSTQLISLSEMCGQLRIVISSRVEFDVERALDGIALAVQIHDHNEESIKRYVSERSQRFFDARGISASHEVEIRNILISMTRRAGGLFIYVRIIMDMLETMHSLDEMRDELKVPPDNLDAAYKRIIYRLGKHNTKRGAEQARRLLGWIACTPTPLTVEEAQQALAVRRGDANRDQTLELVGTLNPVEIIGPIVEIFDGHIQFVHYTAKEYVSSSHLGPQLIDTTEAALDLALRCIDYLCQRHHDHDLSPSDCSQRILAGQYKLHAFATRTWFTLVCRYLQHTKVGDISKDLIDSVRVMWDTRRSLEQNVDDEDAATATDDERERDPNLKITGHFLFHKFEKEAPLLADVLSKTAMYRNSSFSFTGDDLGDPIQSSNDPLSLSHTSQAIREAFDRILCNSPRASILPDEPVCHEDCARIIQLYGPTPFKCKFAKCDSWFSGFRTRSLREKHEASHKKSLRCLVPGCKYGRIGFLSENMRREHKHEAHRAQPEDSAFDTTDMKDEEKIEALRHLIPEKDTEKVQKLLSSSPTLLQDETVHQSILELAAGESSGTMLELLLKAIQGRRLSLTCVEQSIRNHNKSTFTKYLSDFWGSERDYSIQETSRLHGKPTHYLLQYDWPEGMTLWTQRLLGDPNKRKIWILNVYLGWDDTIKLAASCQRGNHNLLQLWARCALPEFVTGQWKDDGLRSVCQYNPSIPLAKHLIGLGANINHQTSAASRAALELAAEKSSRERAELIEFLLSQGANPDLVRSQGGKKPFTKTARDQEGAKNIEMWIGKTWDELVEATKKMREEKAAEKATLDSAGLFSEKGNDTDGIDSDRDSDLRAGTGGGTSDIGSGLLDEDMP